MCRRATLGMMTATSGTLMESCRTKAVRRRGQKAAGEEPAAAPRRTSACLLHMPAVLSCAPRRAARLHAGTYCCYGHSHAPRIDGKSGACHALAVLLLIWLHARVQRSCHQSSRASQPARTGLCLYCLRRPVPMAVLAHLPPPLHLPASTLPCSLCGRRRVRASQEGEEGRTQGVSGGPAQQGGVARRRS